MAMARMVDETASPRNDAGRGPKGGDMPDRRQVLGGLAAALLPLPAHAAVLGSATVVQGRATLSRGQGDLMLTVGEALHEGDLVRTADASRAELLLTTETHITLGAGAELLVERYLADIGGRLVIGGPMVFDRPGSLPKVDLTIVTAFGEIGVRGTRFFAGPSNGVFAVFVQRGAVEVMAQGQTRRLGPGDGVNLPEGAPPGEVVQWGVPRILAAFASVGLVP